MSPCSCDLIVMSLLVKLTGTWFLDSELSTCFDRYYYIAIYPGEFYGSHTFPCQSLLLSTIVLNDMNNIVMYIMIMYDNVPATAFRC